MKLIYFKIELHFQAIDGLMVKKISNFSNIKKKEKRIMLNF